MRLNTIIAAINELALTISSGKKNKNKSTQMQRHEVIITDNAQAEYNKLYKERNDKSSMEMMDKLKINSIAILKTFPHEGSKGGIEVRHDASGNAAAKGMFEIRTPTSLQIRGFVRHLSVDDCTYWVILGFERKKKNEVNQYIINQMNTRFNAIDKSDPLGSNCSIWS